MLSIVVPVFNEAGCLAEFARRTFAMLSTLAMDAEILFVDDGSSDQSLMMLEQLTAQDSRVRVLSFSRNFGHQIAVTAGLHHARGDAVVIIDSDLQDPPEVIPQLVESWRSGGQVVAAVRTERRGESRFKQATATWFYRLIRRWSKLDIELNAGDFRLLDRKAVDAINAMPESFRFVRGMTAWVGFDQRSVTYVRDPRFAGETKYPLKKMVTLASTAITSFSFVPLQLAALFGLIVSSLSILAVPVVIGLRIGGVKGLGGQTTVLIAVLFFGGVQLSFLGLIGEYVGRMSIEIKRRPLYVIAKAFGSAVVPGSGRPDGVSTASTNPSPLEHSQSSARMSEIDWTAPRTASTGPHSSELGRT